MDVLPLEVLKKIAGNRAPYVLAACSTIPGRSAGTSSLINGEGNALTMMSPHLTPSTLAKTCYSSFCIAFFIRSSDMTKITSPANSRRRVHCEDTLPFTVLSCLTTTGSNEPVVALLRFVDIALRSSSAKITSPANSRRRVHCEDTLPFTVLSCLTTTGSDEPGCLTTTGHIIFM
ncbi:hypothetical protein J6590_097918 [Homalodisca vitripennis]|nr:hypothetical protein J6590_097918 [Homalodisca vitripennis]